MASKLEKIGKSFSSFNPFPSMPSVATGDKKQFQYIQIAFKTPFRRSIQDSNKLWTIYFLKSFFVITLVQSKQICSFDRHRRNAHTFDYFGRSERNRFFHRLPNVISDTSYKSCLSSFLVRNPNENPSSDLK